MSPAWLAAQGARTFPGILLIDGVTMDTPAQGLFSFLDPIVSQNIPVSIAFNYDRGEWQESATAPELMQLLFTLTADYSGLIDLTLEVPDIASLQPYLRMRAVSEARNGFRQALVATAGEEAHAAIPKTIVSRLPEGNVPILSGLRSAGILNSILLPKEGMPLDIWRNEDGTQQINGGWRLPRNPTAEDIARTVAEATSREGPVVFAATYHDAALQGQGSAFDRGATIGDGFRRNLVSSRNPLILPSELRFRSGAVFPRHLVLCISGEGSDTPSESLAAKLAAASVPFTEISETPRGAFRLPESASAEAIADEPHRCIRVPSADNENWREARHLAFGGLAPNGNGNSHEPIDCAALAGASATSSGSGDYAGFAVVLNMSDENVGFCGYDGNGALRINVSLVLDGPHPGLSTETLSERIEAAAPLNDDVVLLVRQGGFHEAKDADALVQAIVGLGKFDQFTVMNLGQHRAAVTVKSEQARLLRLARRWPAIQAADEVPSTERDFLIEDAGLAWSYFEQLTDPDTGLVPATSWLEDGELRSYSFNTMWDTGSQILAIISAHRIGLINGDEFSERTRAVLSGLETGVFKGLRLPKGLASTTGTGGGDDKYNASDTARLLVSLYVLENYSRYDHGIRSILDAWDLDKTIRDGVPLTAKGSRLVSSFRSNYSGYIARAFGLWGYPVTSPYSDPQPGSPFDRSVEILHEVAEFGPIGAEPHLLESVELGASELAEAATEALFAAQVEEYLSTGKLVCVSEGPINREPWFVYQGLQIGNNEEKWTAETLDPSPRFKTKGFIRAVDMLNSKAAFLWAACRPGEYSDQLIAKVREAAKLNSIGFSPGVFYVTGTSDQAYSDINTNSIILQSIAYRLSGSKPAVSWDSER